MIKNPFKAVFRFILLFLTAIIIAVTLRVFCFATFTVPSASMEPALLPGDHIVVNKLVFGARIFKGYEFIDTTYRPRYWRMKGLRKVNRNDILVFNYPYSKRGKISLDIDKFFVKRCVAIPGDSFYIENGIYKIKGLQVQIGNIHDQRMLAQMNDSAFDKSVFRCFPKRGSFYWTIKNMGPFYVPRMGDKIQMNNYNFYLYRHLMEYETQMKSKLKGEQVFLNDSLIQEYRFKINYYFMAGDNVLDSRDSRYWGLLPEDHIVGVVALIWKSVDPVSEEVRWERVMKEVR